ncbi:MAG: PAS domain-containing protein, partial [Candidatus Thorarchaeota archaeon]
MNDDQKDHTGKRKSSTEAQKLSIGNEDYYRIITERVKDVIWTSDLDLNILFVSKSVEYLLGYSPDEILTKNLLEFMTPESEKIAIEKYVAAMTIEDAEIQDDPVGFELELKRKNSSTVWVEVSNTFLRDENGDVNAILGVAREITERRKVEEALRESEQQYRSLVEDSLEGIAVTIPDPLHFVFVNAALSDILGYTVHEFLSMNPTQVQEIIYPDDRPRFLEAYQQVLAGIPRPQRTIYRALKKDGSVVWLEVSAGVIDYNGAAAVQGTFIDITERTKTEEKYRTVVQSMRDMIFVYDKNNCYNQIYANDESLLLAPIDELRGKCVTEVMPDEMLENYLQLASKIRNSGGSYSYDYEVTKNGKPNWYTSIISLHEDGESIVSVARDITDRKRIELMLKESEAKFRGLAHTSPAAIFVRLGGKLAYANETTARISGYPLDELLGMNVAQLVHPDQHAMVQKLMNARDQGDKDIYHLELKLVTKTGEIKWLDYWSSLIEYDGLTASVASAIDITEKKQTDDALRTSQAFLAEAQRIAHVGSWDWDIINDVDVWSEENYRIFGVDRKEFTPSYERFLEMVHPEDREEVRKSVQGALNSGKPYSLDHRIIRPDGTIRFVHEEGEATFDERGRPIRMFGIMADLTDRVQAEQLLKESELRYRTFVQNFQGVAYQRYIDINRPIFYHGMVQEITGYSAEDFVDGKIKWTDIVDEDSIDVVIQEINNLRSNDGYIANAEYKIRTKDGDLRWIRD